ncbi:trypsin-like peptidase domain-containing protein [Pikeienuella sp. HZG-20]|uniref:trypsin-like peptidase domain-containing protein n=1 Tax=Paludibacillus litoralis TaxID=3133267 RepID=UPI0030EF4BF6
MRRRWTWAAMTLAASMALTAPAMTGPAAAQQVPRTQEEITLSFAPVVKRAAPAVVNVYSRKVTQRRNPFAGDPFFERFFREFGGPGSGRRIQNSLGSGVILRQDGYVVTNFHVVGGADEVRVVLSDKREFDADIVFADEQSDIAILKLRDVDGLPVLKFRDSDSLEVGDLVLAIGNPFGVGQTVTSGIISALARSSGAPRAGRIGGYFIQTDAAVNPGNSGGALVDMAGRLVGVNSAILTRSGGSNGIGFAIPANLVHQALESALAGETTLRRPWAGIVGQSVTADLAGALGLKTPGGVVIADMHPQSPLKAAGLEVGDVIVAFHGQPIGSIEELSFRMAAVGVGGVAEVTYMRRGKRRTARMPLIEAPASLRRN